MIVALGSTRKPKLEAVHGALARLSGLAPALAGAQVVARDASTVSPRMPLSREELLHGARTRAEHVVQLLGEEGLRADLALGLEGGVEVEADDGERRAFLTCWAYATDGRRGAFGCGGGVELPPALAAAVIDRGEELGTAIDAFAGAHDVRSGSGAWGVLTLGAMDRRAAFEVALIAALAPFYNAVAYR